MDEVEKASRKRIVTALRLAADDIAGGGACTGVVFGAATDEGLILHITGNATCASILPVLQTAFTRTLPLGSHVPLHDHRADDMRVADERDEEK